MSALQKVAMSFGSPWLLLKGGYPVSWVSTRQNFTSFGMDSLCNERGMSVLQSK